MLVHHSSRPKLVVLIGRRAIHWQSATGVGHGDIGVAYEPDREDGGAVSFCF
jgi:hypothetical protein